MGASKKRSKSDWTADKLRSAVKEVKEGRSIRASAAKFNIPESTLRRRVNTNELSKIHFDHKTILSKAQEEKLALQLIKLSNMYYGLTPLQFRRIAFEVAEKLKLKHNFKKDEKVAGKDWLKGFMMRNPSVAVRKPEATSINRIKGFNKASCGRFFMNLESLMEKYAFPESRIFNMDETGISTVQETQNVLAPKGQKRVGSVTSWERGKNTTVVCAMSATGTYIPPMFIFARARNSAFLGKDAPQNSIIHCTKTGWTNQEVYCVWLRHFAKQTKPTAEDPVLLILDNHNSHATIEAYDFCRNNNIHVLSLPPHTSHRLQPLDVSFFGPLKKAFYRECDLFLKSRNFVKITPYDIAGIFKKADSRVCSIDKAVSGFQATGICPLNPNIFTDEDYLCNEDSETTIDDPTETNQAQILLDVVVPVVNGVSMDIHESSEEIPWSTEVTIAPNVGDVVENLPHPSSTDEPWPKKVRHDTFETTQKSDVDVSSLEIFSGPSNLPSTPNPKLGRQQQHSEILTSSPMRNFLEIQKLKRIEILQKAEQARKKKELLAKAKAEKEEEARKKKEILAKAKAEKEKAVREKKELLAKVKLEKEEQARNKKEFKEKMQKPKN